MNKYSVSIIIPTYRRDDFLLKTLTSLRFQTFKDFEVLVCDDGGDTDQTKNICAEFSSYFPIKYLRQENMENLYNPAAARNMGAKNSRGKYLFFLDCDIILPPEILKRMYSWINFPFRNKKYHVVADKRIHIKYDLDKDEIANNINDLGKYKIKGFNKKYEGVSLSCAGIILKDIFFKIGGFDEILFAGLRGQDLELMYRLEVFFNNKTKKNNNVVYHVDNRNINDKRRIDSGRNENFGREMIKKKFISMGFDIKGKRPIKNYQKHNDKHYNRFIENKELMHSISRNLHKEVNKYYHVSQNKNKLDIEYNNLSTNTNPLVYIVILNFNGLRWLKICLPSVLKTNYPNFKILVVDNNSSDNSVEYVKNNFPQIEVLKLSKNLGYAGGNNKGISYAYRLGADYMAVLNNDTEVHPDWLKELVKVGENNFAVGALGPLILSGDGKYIQGSMKGFNKPTYSKYQKDKISPKESSVGKVVGCAILFKRKALEKVGLFDRAYFCYQEEFDWCQRARFHGFDIYKVPSSIIYHYGFKTSAKKKNYIYYKMYFLFNANEIRRFLKDPNKPLRKLLKYVIFKHYFQLPRENRNPTMYLISCSRNIIMLPHIIYKRKIEKKGGCYL